MMTDNTYLAIGHLNIEGIYSQTFSKCDDLLCDEQIQNLDVLCLTETHCQSSHAIYGCKINNVKPLQVYRCDRAGKGGGVAVLVNEIYKRHRLTISEPPMEIVGVQINDPHRVTVFCIYIPPRYDMHTYIQYLKYLLDTQIQGACVILGDFK